MAGEADAGRANQRISRADGARPAGTRGHKAVQGRFRGVFRRKRRAQPLVGIWRKTVHRGRKGAAVLRRHGRDAGGRGRIHPHADHRARAERRRGGIRKRQFDISEIPGAVFGYGGGQDLSNVPCAAGQHARGGRAVADGRKLEADGGKQRLYREPNGGHGHVHHRAGRIPGVGAGQCENHRITHG